MKKSLFVLITIIVAGVIAFFINLLLWKGLSLFKLGYMGLAFLLITSIVLLFLLMKKQKKRKMPALLFLTILLTLALLLRISGLRLLEPVPFSVIITILSIIAILAIIFAVKEIVLIERNKNKVPDLSSEYNLIMKNQKKVRSKGK